MSQIRQGDPLLAVLLLLVVLSLTGCGSSNSQSNFDSASGQHSAGWLPDGHMTEAKASLEACTQCHGADYTGGISRISCTTCHMGGVASIHPPWGTPDYAKHGSYVKSNDTSGCANARCHGTNLDGAGGAGGPSCSSCHMGGVASIHPPWGTPVYAQHGTYVKSNSNDTSGCANATCHGTNLTGVSGSGPSCTLCHMGGVASIHPAEWNGNTLLHKTKAGYTNIESCKNIVCHGAALEGVNLSGPSCYICH